MSFSGARKIFQALKGVTGERLEEILNRRILRIEISEIIVFLLITVYTLVFSYYTIQKHYALSTYAWDFGNYHQALWTTVNAGKLFYFTPESYLIPSGSFFGLHFSPILFLILPVYATHQAPETLLVFQAFIISLAALPLYWFTRDNLNSKTAAVVFSAAYLLYPPLQGANWFDFHVQAFLPLFFFLAMHYLKRENWVRYFVFLALALTVAESVPVVVLFIGFYTALLYRKAILAALRKRTIRDSKLFVPVATMTLAASYFFLARWIKNTFFPVDPRFSQFYYASDFWRVLGIEGDPTAIPLQVVLNPLKALEALGYDMYLKALFIVLIFGSLLFLSFRSSIVIITLAWLGPALLSNHQSYYALGIHYPLYFIPFVFLAAVDGIRKTNLTVDTGRLWSVSKNLLILAVIFWLFASPLSPLLNATEELYIPHFSEYRAPSVTEHALSLQRVVQFVPQNASILTQNNLFPQVSGRLNAYVFPLPHAINFAPSEMNAYVNDLLAKSEYVLLDIKTDTYGAGALFYDRSSFGLLISQDGIYLYQKSYEGQPLAEIPG